MSGEGRGRRMEMGVLGWSGDSRLPSLGRGDRLLRHPHGPRVISPPFLRPWGRFPLLLRPLLSAKVPRTGSLLGPFCGGSSSSPGLVSERWRQSPLSIQRCF